MLKIDPSALRAAMRAIGLVFVAVSAIVPDPWRAVVMSLGTAVAAWANRAPGMIDASNPVQVMNAAKSMAPPAPTPPPPTTPA